MTLPEKRCRQPSFTTLYSSVLKKPVQKKKAAEGPRPTRQAHSDRIHVVLDSTEIVARKFRLDGAHIAVLERAIALKKIKLFVPQIVIEETLNKHREYVSDAKTKVSKAVNEMNLLLDDAKKHHLKETNIDDASQQFRNRFENRLDALAAERPRYDNVPQSETVLRDLQRRRPFRDFDKGSKGYRDALIWETIIHNVMTKDGFTVFITQNISDFCDVTSPSRFDLHPDLREDLINMGLDPNRIEVFPTIQSFVEKRVKALLPTFAVEAATASFSASQLALREISSNAFRSFKFLDFFQKERTTIGEKLTSELNTRDVLGEAPIDIESFTVQYIEDPVSVDMSEAEILDEHRLYLTYDVSAEVNVQFFVFKGDYYALGDDENYFEIEDSDWNNHYILATKSVLLPIILNLVLKLGEHPQVEQFDVGMKEFYGRCWRCDHPLFSDTAETCPNCKADLLQRWRRSQRDAKHS